MSYINSKTLNVKDYTYVKQTHDHFLSIPCLDYPSQFNSTIKLVLFFIEIPTSTAFIDDFQLLIVVIFFYFHTSKINTLVNSGVYTSYSRTTHNLKI